MTEFYARKDYIYDGDSRIFTIPFPLIDTRFIKVYVNGVSTSWLKLNDSQLQVADWVTLNAGDIISIRRETPINEQMVIFSDKSILNEENQNLAQKQLFYSMQELYDNNNQFKEDVENVLENTVTEVTNTVEEFKTDIEESINEGDSNLQTQFDNFKSTINLTAERIDLIDSSVVVAVNNAEIAKSAAEEAEEYANQAKTYSQSTSATLSEISTAKENALSEITTSKNETLLEIQEAAAPAISGFENYYSKTEIDTMLGDIGSLLDEINGEVI